MRLSASIDQILKGVCFVGVQVSGRFTPLGTAFFVARRDGGENFGYLVTARHVIDQLDDSIKTVSIRLNLSEGGMTFLQIPRASWRFHPNKKPNSYVDVAVVPLQRPQGVKLLVMQIEDAELTFEGMQKDNIGIGTETFTIGLFTNHAGENRNFPVARFGHLALLSQEELSTEFGYMEGHLVEAHSLGGSSGSPVFVSPELWRIENGHPKLAGTREWYFLGLISGTWTQENPEDAIADSVEKTGTGRINTGMMIVVPVGKVKEALDQSELKPVRSPIKTLVPRT